MNRDDFRKLFSTDNPVVTPVIHVLDNEQTDRNVRSAIDGGCQGVFLINHDFEYQHLLPIIEHVRDVFPDLWMGVNFLAITGKEAFPELGKLSEAGTVVNAYWADDARIDEHRAANEQIEAEEILSIKASCGWNGMYFGGTAFKKQREVAKKDFGKSAEVACEYMDVVTTSGVATGSAADKTKIKTFRKACGDKPLALASGITPENAGEYSKHVDCFMVATGINFKDDFYNIDPQRLRQLIKKLEV
ncbi:MAG: BtpA/SgcQ family protein [Pseudomonadota bacterium]